MEFYPICDETLSLSPNMWYSMSGLGESPFMRVGHTIVHYRPDNNQVDRGKLIVIGGANPSECFKEIFVLDLNTLAWDKFEDTTNFATGRYEHACFISKENRVCIFGGADQEKNFNDVIQFNIELKTCETIATQSAGVPSPRTIHCGVSFKGQLLVFGGGETGKNAVVDPKIYILNPTNKKWIALNITGPKAPQQRHGHVMINFDNKNIYLHGGMNADTILNDLWVLDLTSMSWTEVETDKESSPCARAAHGGICINKNLYIFGGIGESGSALDDLWKFDTG